MKEGELSQGNFVLPPGSQLNVLYEEDEAD
jgi:hypothetical protein